MKLKLIINGGDRRVRIEPVDKFDIKLLGLLSEMKTARIHTQERMYSGREVEYIDLFLGLEEELDKNLDRALLIQRLKENREKYGRGNGDDYWNSIADIVENI